MKNAHFIIFWEERIAQTHLSGQLWLDTPGLQRCTEEIVEAKIVRKKEMTIEILKVDQKRLKKTTFASQLKSLFVLRRQLFDKVFQL